MNTNNLRQYLISDICGNCGDQLIYAIYFDENDVQIPEREVPVSEVHENQKERYQKIKNPEWDMCKCNDPYPDVETINL